MIVCLTPPQMNDFCDLLGTPYAPVSKIAPVKRVHLQVGKNVKIVKKSEPLVYFFKNASHVVKKKSNQKHVHVHNMCLTSFTRICIFSFDS